MLRRLIAVICLSFAGCVYLPFCAPEVDHLAGVKLPSSSDDVHVFRVDGVEKSWRGGGMGDGPGYGLDESHELTRLQPTGQKAIAPQWAFAVETGFIAGSLIGGGIDTTKHTLAVRFYRRGFETIEIKPGDAGKELKWKPAADLADREKAVDDLIVDSVSGGGLFFPHISYQPVSGAKSPAHREALRFCAEEYDRIRSTVVGNDTDAKYASCYPATEGGRALATQLAAKPRPVTAEEMRTRLTEKAKRLRDLADGK